VQKLHNVPIPTTVLVQFIFMAVELLAVSHLYNVSSWHGY